MSEGKIVVGIDIGTSKIVTLIAKVDEEVNVLGVSESPANGVRKGQIVDIDEAVLSINNSLEAAERMAAIQPRILLLQSVAVISNHKIHAESWQLLVRRRNNPQMIWPA